MIEITSFARSKLGNSITEEHRRIITAVRYESPILLDEKRNMDRFLGLYFRDTEKGNI